MNSLLKALNDTDEQVRSKAAFSLGEIRLFPDKVVPQLAASLTDTNRFVQGTLQYAIRNYGTNAHKAVPALLMQLNRLEGFHKGEVVATLRMVDETTASQAGFGNSDLIKMLRSNDEQTKYTASVAIWQSGDDSSEFIPALIEAISKTNVGIQGFAMIILGDYGKSASNAFPALTRALTDPSETVRRRATNAIKRIDSHWTATNSIKQ